jgi:hypothetical protein
MALTFVDSAEAALRADGDTVGITVTHGFTMQDGDVLYAFLSRSDDLGEPWVLSGWTLLFSQASTTGNDMMSTALRKVITNAAGEPASYTFLTSAGAGTNQQTAVIVQVRGANTTTPEDAQISDYVEIANDFTPFASDGSGIIVNTTGALILAVHHASMNDGVTGKTPGAPSTMTIADGIESVLAGQLGSFTEVAYKENMSATFAQTSWTGTPTDSTSEAHVGWVTVNPAASGAFEIDAQDDAYAVTGTAATVIAARMVSSDPGTYTYTGVLASLLTTRLVSSDPGVYAITGFDTDLVYVPATGDFELNAATGTYSLTGSAATVVAGYALDGDPAGYTLTGYDLDFGQERIPILPAGEPGIVADYGRGRIREQVLV